MAFPSGERRIKTRYEAPCLKVRLRERGFLGMQKSILAVACIDLNRYGMAVISPRPIEPGSRLSLDFDGKYISESRVSARVVSIQKFQAGYRLGIRFSYCHEKGRYCRTVDNALSRIEGFYNRLAS